MNIYDIAKRTGLSTATISRVINDRGKVSEKNRQIVLDVMKELNFQPNIFARGLNGNPINIIGVMCSDVTDLYYAKAVSVIEKELKAHQYDVLLCCTGNNLESKKKSMELLLSKRVDMIILVGSIFKEHDDNSHILAATKQAPVIIINATLDFPNTYSILCNDAEMVVSLVKRLAAAGKTKILYLNCSDSYCSMQKINGYKEGLACANIAFDKNLFARTTLDIYAAMEKVIEVYKSTPFDAVIASDDVLAVGALKAAKHLGLCVPKDLAIIGYGNTILAQSTEPEISSVEVMVESLSTLAVKTALDVMNHVNTPAKIVLTEQLIERGTTPSHL